MSTISRKSPNITTCSSWSFNLKDVKAAYGETGQAAENAVSKVLASTMAEVSDVL